WSLIALARLTRRRTRNALHEQYRKAPQLMGYLLCWIVMPLVFFTFAENILVTYVMASLPALAILIATRLDTLAVSRRFLVVLAAGGLAVFFGGLGLAWSMHYNEHRYNQKPIAEAYEALNRKDPGPLIYTGSYRFSAVFYTRNHVVFTARPMRYVTDATFYMAVRNIWNKSISRALAPRCRQVLYHSDFYLYYCPAIGEK
ncbi:MAG TPA: hypothetical protein VJ998_06475, partial [Pseudomonadales bacterium]|nr:hypothetical protein [Pseudomonadales bacterium]